MTITLDDRRTRVVLEGAYQIDGMAQVLLDSNAIMQLDASSTLRALLLRMQALNIVTMRAIDESDTEINDMECIVFGRVQVHEDEHDDEEEEAVT